MPKFIRRLRVRYWDRFARYRQWRDIFVKAGWSDESARQQAWRQSAWYDPATGRSIKLIENLQGLGDHKETQ